MVDRRQVDLNGTVARVSPVLAVLPAARAQAAAVQAGVTSHR